MIQAIMQALRNKEHTLLSRREFIALSAASTAALAGCAINPVTGRRQLMFMSEPMEIELDRKWSPHQFSSDYGPVQDPALNQYINSLGQTLSVHTHRPGMPYNYRALNTVVVNAYTFPAGSMGFARGLLLELNNEAELVAVLGHEMGHVSARHVAQQQTKGMLAQMIVAGISVYVEQEHKDYAVLAAGLGALGAGALLSRYSRDNERQADKLGMEYMTKAGYDPGGMCGVMATFQKLHKSEPSVVDQLFASHPMSSERFQTAQRRVNTQYAHMKGAKLNRERYMDKTARIRKMGPAIREMQKGQKAMLKQQYPLAASHYSNALRSAPYDYAGMVMMAKCQMAMKKHASAQSYAAQAKRVYATEPQAYHVSGMSNMNRRKFDAALQDFASYETRLPGNPNTVFFRGYCHDKMQRKQQASNDYVRYLRAAPRGEYSGWTRKRLVEWGVIKPQPQGGSKQ